MAGLDDDRDSFIRKAVLCTLSAPLTGNFDGSLNTPAIQLCARNDEHDFAFRRMCLVMCKQFNGGAAGRGGEEVSLHVAGGAMRHPVAHGHCRKQVHNNDCDIDEMKMQETPLIGDASLLCRAAGLLVDLQPAAKIPAARSPCKMAYPIT